MGLAELFEFKLEEVTPEEVEELKRRIEKMREIHRELDKARELVDYCLHYRTGTTCRLAIEKLRKIAKEIEKEVFPYARLG